MGPTPDEIEAGHAFYTRRALRFYDPAILGFFSRTAWKCPASTILDHYNAHVTANHLDVGVGTGYFLDKCRFPTPTPRLGLMDLNTNCLDVASRRAARYEPETYVADVLEPIPFDAPKFDSIGMNYLLHCLPGTIQSKGVAFEHLKAVANPDAVVFGATLLHDGVRRNWFARQVMGRNNKHGIFSNEADDVDGLNEVLSEHLRAPKVVVVGCVGMFSGLV